MCSLTAANSSEPIRVFSFQHQDVVKTLQKLGQVHPDRTSSNESPGWELAYLWMASELAQTRLVHPDFKPSRGSLFWGWVDPTEGFIDQLIADNAPQAEQIQLCTFAIDPVRLLLSDFDHWDHLINESDPAPHWAEIFSPRPGVPLQAVWSDLRAGDLIRVTQMSR
jgi:hypothetical protein